MLPQTAVDSSNRRNVYVLLRRLSGRAKFPTPRPATAHHPELELPVVRPGAALRDGKQKHIFLTGVLDPWLAEHNAIDCKSARYAFSAASANWSICI